MNSNILKTKQYKKEACFSAVSETNNQNMKKFKNMFQEKARDYVKTNGKNVPEPEKIMLT